MALSPPAGPNSVTIAVMSAPAASTTTAYCWSAGSCATLHGSTRSPPPEVSVTFCVVTSAPSLKRYHRRVAAVAVTLWRMIGVVQPVVGVGLGQKQSDFVILGR